MEKRSERKRQCQYPILVDQGMARNCQRKALKDANYCWQHLAQQESFQNYRQTIKQLEKMINTPFDQELAKMSLTELEQNVTSGLDQTKEGEDNKSSSPEIVIK